MSTGTKISTTPSVNYFIMQKYSRTGHQFTDGDFINPIPVSMERPSFPFEGDTQNFILEQDYVQYIDWYLEKVPTPGSTNPKYPDLYFLHDTPIQDLGGGVGKWTRTWGLLPGFNGERLGVGSAYVRREAQSFVWTRPGVASTNTLNLHWGVDNPSSTATLGTTIKLYTHYINGSGAPRYTHDVNANYNSVLIGYYVTDPTTGIWRYLTYSSLVYSRGTDYVEVDPVPYKDAGIATSVWYDWFGRPEIKINPTQIVINTFLYMDYWMPGINCTDPESIPLVQAWYIEDQNLNVTDTVTEVTNPPLYTNLTRKGYWNMVQDGDLICMESSVLRRWQGNVWERTTRYGVIQ